MNYHAVLEMIKSRKSVRSFTDYKPSHEEIESIIEAARWAPSNHNRQGWKFIIFEDSQQLRMLAEKIRESLSRRFESAGKIASGHVAELIHYATIFANAPVAILVMHKKPVAVGRELLTGTAEGNCISGEPLSVAMAVQNMLLAAHSLEFGTCVLTAPLLAEDVWKELDDLPVGFEPTCIVAVGKPADLPPIPRRKPLEQIMEYRSK